MIHPLLPTQPPRWADWSGWGAPGRPAFTAEECDRILDHADQQPTKLGTVTNAGYIDPAVRSVDVVEVAPTDMPWLFTKIETIAADVNRHYWNLDLTHMDFIEVLRYQPGGHFLDHVDVMEGNATRKLSIVVLLSDPADYEGGELIIRSRHDPTPTPRERGSIIVFPSWTLHGVTPVTAGERRVATCWVHGPPYR